MVDYREFNKAKEQEDYWRKKRQDLEHDLFIERAKEELKHANIC
jgi:hypothetical protein